MVQPVRATTVPAGAVEAPAKDQVQERRGAVPAPDAVPAVNSQVRVEPDIRALEAAADKINAHLGMIPTALQFRVDNDTGRVVVKVVNSETNEVIRQIPSEELLVISRALDESASKSGLLVNKKA